MIHFTLSVEEAFSEREVYVYGAFNDLKLQMKIKCILIKKRERTRQIFY